MQGIYSIISSNPGYFAWVFGLVNVLWLVFLHFNNKRHDRELEKLKDELSLESDRRRRVFELKTTQYEAYVTLLDKVGRNQHSGLAEKFTPIVQEYFSKAFDEDLSPEDGLKNLQWFNSQIMKLSKEGVADLMHIRNESSRLKLTATDEMLRTFELIDSLVQKSMDMFNDFMNELVDMVTSSNTELMDEKSKEMAIIGDAINDARERMIYQMRNELQQI